MAPATMLLSLIRWLAGGRFEMSKLQAALCERRGGHKPYNNNPMKLAEACVRSEILKRLSHPAQPFFQVFHASGKGDSDVSLFAER